LGWQPDVPPVFAVSFDPSQRVSAELLGPDIVPTFSADAFVAGGAALQGEALQFGGLLALIELQNGDDPPGYVAGTRNFYVITRYNQSSFYALSVIELGRAVRAAMEQPNP
jgi:membrane-bound lytic murein transglycosylase B